MREVIQVDDVLSSIKMVLHNGNLVKFVIGMSEYCGKRLSDKEIELLHTLADGPGMSRALSLVENVEFVRQRLYKDSVESENYARGLREELGAIA